MLREEGTIYIAHEGKPYSAYYEVDEKGIITVISSFGKKSSSTHSRVPRTLARIIFKEMVESEIAQKLT